MQNLHGSLPTGEDEPFRWLSAAPKPSWEHRRDRKSTRLNSSHQIISYAVFCLKKKKPWKTSTRSPVGCPTGRSRQRRRNGVRRIVGACGAARGLSVAGGVATGGISGR